MKRLYVVLIWSTGLLSDVPASEWSSSDGVISVEAPDRASFDAMEPIPPMSVLWRSKDRTTMLAIVENPLPDGFKAQRNSMEEGYIEEVEKMGGRLIASSVEQRQGHDVFLMTARGQLQGIEFEQMQAILVVDRKAYKLMANMMVAKALNADAEKFIRSLKVNVQGSPKRRSSVSIAPKKVSPPELPKKSLVDRLSERIGGISLLALVFCAIFFAIKRLDSRRRLRHGRSEE